MDVLDRQVDGVVIVAFHLSTAELAHVPLADVPLVSIGSHLDHPSIDLVRTDDGAGARDATRHLLELGHSVGLIGGPPGLPPSESRAAGYREALADAGARSAGIWSPTATSRVPAEQLRCVSWQRYPIARRRSSARTT